MRRQPDRNDFSTAPRRLGDRRGNQDAGRACHSAACGLGLLTVSILIIEDDSKTAALLRDCLSGEGFEIEVAADGEAGLAKALEGAAELLLVDVMLPKLDGLSLVRKLRARGNLTPVIMLSARGEIQQRVEGLDAGADDYLPKPYATSELLARVRSQLRRNQRMAQQWVNVGDLAFHTGTRETRVAGQRVDLSPRESLLLECLLQAEGRVVSRRDIIQTVWEYDFDPGTNLVDVYIRRLREKIDRSHSPGLIQTVRGLGYSLRLQP